jgi:hypothetical protein
MKPKKVKIIRVKTETVVWFNGKKYHFTDDAKNLCDEELIKRCNLSDKCDDIFSFACR